MWLYRGSAAYVWTDHYRGNTVITAILLQTVSFYSVDGQTVQTVASSSSSTTTQAHDSSLIKRHQSMTVSDRGF